MDHFYRNAKTGETVALRHAELAALFGIPPERLTFEATGDGELTVFRVRVDDRKLTVAEDAKFVVWLRTQFGEHEVTFRRFAGSA